MTKKLGEIINNVFLLTFRQIVTLFISLYSTKLAIQLLGGDFYGFYGLLISMFSMLSFIGNAVQGTSQRFIGIISESKEVIEINRVYNLSVILHIISGICSLFLFNTIGYLFFQYFLHIPLKIIDSGYLSFFLISFGVAINLTFVYLDVLMQINEKFRVIAIFSVVDIVLRFLVTIVLYTLDFKDINYYSALILLVILIINFVKLIYCRIEFSDLKLNTSVIFEKKSRKLFLEMIKFSNWSLLGAITSMVNYYGLNLIINKIGGLSLNTTYSLISQLIGLIQSLILNVNKVITPVIMKAEGNGERNFLLLISLKSSRLVLLFLFSILSIYIIGSEYVFIKWIGYTPKYYFVLGLFLISKLIIDQSTGLLVPGIYASGEVKKYQIISSIFYLMPVVLILFFSIYSLNMSQIIISYVITGIANHYICLYYLKSILKLELNIYLKELLVPVLKFSIIGLFSAMCIELLDFTNEFKFIFIFCLGILMYQFGIRKEEKAKLNYFLNPNIKFKK